MDLLAFLRYIYADILVSFVIPHLPIFFTGALGILSLALVSSAAWPSRPQKGDDARALLVIAHPDDEAMFFLPTIRSLQHSGFTVDILCLSNGGGGGHGPVRERELLASAAVLGIPEEDVSTLDDPKMQDGMQIWWETEDVKKAVQKHVKDSWGGKRRRYELVSLTDFLTFF
jgi:GlcNAc-PI de-N-acetylase